MVDASSEVRRIAINTGGGDAPGLNAVIRAVVLAAMRRGWEVYGIESGYAGLLEGRRDGLVRLDDDRVRGITHEGGTILGTTNRGNPFAWAEEGAEGEERTHDRSAEFLEAFRAHGFDALIAIGGDGSLGIARDLAECGLPVVGVPKTIDNDLAYTDLSFGFLTAVDTATDALDKLHSTAESHQRVMIVEVMGRHSGWIALYSGLAGTADVILIPEIPYTIERVCEKIRAREAQDRHFSIVCVAEGAHPVGGPMVTKTVRAGREEQVRLGGIGERIAIEVADATGKETRALTLGHLQRGGSPNAYDRLLSLRFGTAAVDCVAAGHFGCAVGLVGDHVKPVTLDEALRERKFVDPDGELVATARDLGISFGG
jgi:ATP-dependent phosphofructokinase / diphosphate-dependent phosphofructokinase